MSPRRITFALAIFSAVPLLVACPKKETPEPPEAAPPPVEEEASTTELIPLEEPLDAGEEDADADAAPKKLGPAVNTNVARLRQCCAQLGIQAKAMQNTPEGGMFQQAAAQCNATAAALGPNASAPEMGAIKTILAGRNIPPVCAKF